MSDKPTVTNRDPLDQTVERPVLLSALALEDQGARSRGQNAGSPDDAGSRFDEVDEWFARAAAGRTCDDDAAPSREVLGAATFPLEGGTAQTPRSGQPVVRAFGLPRLCPRGRALLLGTFGTLALVVVVVIVMRSVTSRPSTSATPPVVVTEEGASTDTVGDPVDHSLKVRPGREKRHGVRRRAVTEADRRRANERRHRVQRQLVATRRQKAARFPTQPPAPASDAPASASARALASPTRPRQPHRSLCGPFDLC